MPRRGRRQPDSGATGCVIVDKPAGCTSHDVVDDVRRALGTRKVGHAGTLDPDATGVLVLGVGGGTKLLQFVTGADKSYIGRLRFGTETSTLDASGEVTATHDMTVSVDDAQAAAAAFVGDIEQIPPMVSAVKVDGKRLHELAREGKEIAREPRPVTVTRYELAATDDPLVFELAVDCSSGTYIRTLAADLGTALGGGAHLEQLRRSAVGPFTIDDACPLDAIELRPLSDLLRGMTILDVDAVVAGQVRNGRPLGPAPGSGRLAIRGPDEKLLAVYEARDGELRPVKVLA
ncbi:MAG: tRNA pseudouridine(55) synthase TruB [Acidimicrobiales bacterium]